MIPGTIPQHEPRPGSLSDLSFRRHVARTDRPARVPTGDGMKLMRVVRSLFARTRPIRARRTTQLGRTFAAAGAERLEDRINPAPPLLQSFDAISYNDNAPNGSRFIPPDTNGAAGPNHVVTVVNCMIRWHTKAGTLQNDQTLSSFFSSLSPLTTTFDPKVVYDQFADRF